MAGQAKENLPGGSLKYLFVYLKVRILITVYVYIYIYIIHCVHSRVRLANLRVTRPSPPQIPCTGKMLQEKAIGVLVDGNSSLQSTAGTSLLGRLFTREDGFNIHKVLLGI